MNRVAWISMALALLVAATFFYDFDTDLLDSGVKNTSAAAKNTQLPSSADVAMRDDAGAEFESEITPTARTQTRTADPIAEWARVADSEDQNERNTAIDALTSIPKTQALPLLQKIIGRGTADDRESALNALRTLARNQGDIDGEIQNVLRLTIYDGDESIAASAQSALDDVENDGGRSVYTTP